MIPSGATKSPTPTPDPFTNTYSLAFDGVDDYVIAPLDGTSTGGILAASDSDVELTISFWFKLNAGANPAGVFQWANSLSDGTPFLLLQQNLIPTNVKFVIDGGFRTPINVNLSQWYNMTLTRTASDNTWRAYLDGVEVISYDDGGTITNRASATDIYLGNGYGGYSPCNIDEVAVFNKVLTPTEISEIYNSGVPNDLTSLNPVAWYRNGDNGTWKSPQWLIPNNSNKDKVSNYSFEFDGVDDEILTSSSFVAAGEFTLSIWINPTILNSNQNILGNGTSSQNWINPSSATSIRVKPAGTLLTFSETGGNNLTVGSWNHILIYRNLSNDIGIFVNGATFGTTANNSNTLTLATIGRGVNRWFSGNVDEVAFWNTNKSSDISSIYSGGTPTDLSSLSPVAYYKMGEEATFVYNVNPEGTWTIPDQVGSNDGISNNTFLDTGRVGDAPNSLNNAVSFNQVEADRKTDIPS